MSQDYPPANVRPAKRMFTYMVRMATGKNMAVVMNEEASAGWRVIHIIHTTDADLVRIIFEREY